MGIRNVIGKMSLYKALLNIWVYIEMLTGSAYRPNTHQNKMQDLPEYFLCLDLFLSSDYLSVVSYHAPASMSLE